MTKRLSIKAGRKKKDKSGFMSDVIWVSRILKNKSKGRFKITKKTLFAGPMIQQEEVDFWAERLEKLGTPYILAMVEFNERDEVETGERGKAFFVEHCGE